MQQGCVLARATGRVQGVGYRAWVRTEAWRLGLSGWVRNESDGSVTALLVGSDEAVTRMVEAMRRGPPGAAVAGVTTQPAEQAEPVEGFEIRR